MRKIEITKKEKEFVDKMNMDFGRDAFTSYMRIRGLEGTPLNDLSYSDVSLIFNGWYEVKDTYKVGDYVYDLQNDKYHKITEVFNDHTVSFEPLEGAFNLSYESGEKPFTKVNESWKIMLLELGRKKPEVLIGDAIVTKDYKIHRCESGKRKSIYQALSNEEVVWFYPAEKAIFLK